MDHEEEVLDRLCITLEDSLDLEERFESNIHLVARLIADNKPSQIVVDQASLSQASILVDQSNGHKPNNLVSHPNEKARLAINQKIGRLVHLPNLKSKGTRHKR
ncbi:hypothetical protein C1H46_011626 [Malus baccata]|uniref:Uncharacterized protein n=1 Tax=Malus baccata TaxID=106549 RepID=A0A540MVG6_MALBA|nr:hypothetical protein C1H46_011626 [Malus baccata]